VRAAAPRDYEQFKAWFVGRVDDPGVVYANARVVLLPTISGHGLSIKTVEAMASGLPLIATRLALRGMKEDAVALPGVTIADDAASFAKALRNEAGAAHVPTENERRLSAVRAYYDAHFSAGAYERNLALLIGGLLSHRQTLATNSSTAAKNDPALGG
jgi:polysaccharide biosynthesis protein PslH